MPDPLTASAAHFAGARLLYVLPHADDELFAAGLLAANVGEQQRLVWLTHGGPLAALRARERRRMAGWLSRRLGVTASCLELADGDSSGWGSAAAAALAAVGGAATVVVTTAAEGEHGDHDAAGVLCRRALPAARLVTVPCYDRGWRRRRRVGRPAAGAAPGWQRVTLGAPLLRLRLRLALGYPSQWPFLLPMVLAGGRAFLSDQWFHLAVEAG